MPNGFVDFPESISFVEALTANLQSFLVLIKHLLSFLGAAVIIMGALVAFYRFLKQAVDMRYRHAEWNYDSIRRDLATMIILGLEFIVASDVIETTTAPDYYSLGILGGLVIIRTFLNFTLDREVKNLNVTKVS